MKTTPAYRLVVPFLTALSLFSFGTIAQAQQPAPAAPPPPAPPAAAPPAGAPPAPVPPPSAEVPPPQPPAEVPPPPVDVPPPATATIDERMADAEQKIEGLTESLSTTNATLSPIAKLKFSGYIQGQYEAHQESTSGLTSTSSPTPTNLDRFSVRRGRLKATYTGENAEYLLQIDATGDAVVLKDAEATFVDTWTPFNFRLTAGQFKVPFGYEVLQSSADREMPERATVIRTLFPGERDRGVRLVGTYHQFKLMFAAVNGNFTQGDPLYGTRDQNRHADYYLRLSGDFDFLVVGVSGQWGQKLASSLTPGALTITDTNMDGIIQANEIMRPSQTTRMFNLWRVGADAQFYIDIPSVGGLALKGEVIYSNDDVQDFRATLANPCLSKTGLGYILTGVQNIGDHFGVVARYDSWNPTTNDLDPGCMDTATGTMATAVATDRINTLGGGLIGYISANLKFTAIYEWLTEQGTNKKDNNILTVRLQARF